VQPDREAAKLADHDDTGLNGGKRFALLESMRRFGSLPAQWQRIAQLTKISTCGLFDFQ